MKPVTFLTTLVLLPVLSLPVDARTWRITSDGTGDYPDIRAAIAAAANGDTVLLAAGTYSGARNRNNDFLGKAITVTSESGPDVTIIDGQTWGRGFLFQNGEGPSSVLSRVTIQNCLGSDEGGGIYCVGASPTISNNIIRWCSANGPGGGVYCFDASPTISDNAIEGNYAGTYGGGIYCYNSSPTISYNSISDGRASRGGGIFCLNANPSIVNNVICGNGVDSYGGGIYCESSSPTTDRNVICGNTAPRGGGVAIRSGSSPTISNSTITGNSGSFDGGGILFNGGAVPVSNTIVAFSISGQGMVCFTGGPILVNCDVYGNAGGDALCGGDGGGNVSVDPLFCDATNGLYYLFRDSPCLNNPGYGQIGVFGAGCGPTAVQRSTWGRLKSLFR